MRYVISVGAMGLHATAGNACLVIDAIVVWNALPYEAIARLSSGSKGSQSLYGLSQFQGLKRIKALQSRHTVLAFLLNSNQGLISP